MLQGIKQIISPSSSSQGDASSLTDTYFNEIGFKCADNSMLGSTESPDLDGEGLFLDDRSDGLDIDLSAPDVEEAKPEPRLGADKNPRPESQEDRPNGLSRLKAYSTPFQSYFSQLLSQEGKSSTDSLKFSPRSYNIDFRQSHEDDVSTLGEGSFAPRKSPMWGLQPPAATMPEIQPTRTSSTSEESNTKDSSDDQSEQPRPNQLSRDSSKHSSTSRSSKDSSSTENAAEASKWKIIYFITGVALFLLSVSCAVLAIGVIQLKQNEKNGVATTIAPMPSPFDDYTWQPTQDPATTEVPTATIRQDLLRIVSVISPDSLSTLSDTNSPQFNAFEWVANDPDFALYPLERIVQRWVLATFFYSALGPAWNFSRRLSASNMTSSWMDYSNECDWYSTDPHDMCDEDGHIVAIHLDGTGLQGTIPFELILLSESLERLYLPNNNITGTIPFEFGQLTKLERLQLSVNRIEGSIPRELGSMSSLVVLGLGRNQINGALPEQLGQLESLKTLGLEGNQITGTIPVELSMMTSLEHFSLESNDLHGTVPMQLGELSRLSSFTVHQNNLIGTMPTLLCPSFDDFMTTLRADCSEIQCDCCTECCIGCSSAGGGVLAKRTEAPTEEPTAAPSPNPTSEPSATTEYPTTFSTSTPTVAPTGLIDLLRPTIAGRGEALWPNPTTFFLGSTAAHSSIPSDFPSLTPSSISTSSPTQCLQEVLPDKKCYSKSNDTIIQVDFHSCHAEPGDWVGLFHQRNLFSLQVDHLFSKQEADLWVKLCGDQECGEVVTSGSITLGADQEHQRLPDGQYKVILVRNNKANASSTFFELSTRNCE